ncbi:MAG: EAL domain-containing protein [Campylobacterota bacterium]|nr:EAL domain-containing protein [Campylobacterota bacterium]
MNIASSSEKYKVLVENAVVGIYIICENRFTYVNSRLAEIFAYSCDEMLEMSPLELTHKEDRGIVEKNIKKRLKNDIENIEYSFRALRKDGEIRNLHVYGTISIIDGKKAIMGTIIDETDKKLATSRLEYLANYDSLTGLYNRYYFNMQSEHIMNQARRNENKIAILLFDIDNFKRINDSLGHKAGDVVLVRTAELVSEVLRDSDSFYRIGGDEFTVIMENFNSTNEVKILVKRIQQALRTSIEVDEFSFHISLSIGVSIYPEHGEDMSALQKSADVAMYQAKKDGKNCFSIFAKDSGSSSKILELEDELYEGLERGEMEIYLQPQIDLKTDYLLGAEALVRWNNPKRGVLAPAVFLPLAKEMGLLYKLDLIMIENVFLLLERYEKLDMLDFTISVNISHALFHHQRFFSIMQKFHHRYTYLCNYMVLELTEDILMVDNAHAIKITKSLKLIGYRLAIDDFGTGYSSFGHLKMMPIHELKIDRGFIRDIAHESKDKAIVKAIVDMGHTLDLTVVAEGAEDREQVKLLKEMNCDVVQGYFYSKPVTVEDFQNRWLV